MTVLEALNVGCYIGVSREATLVDAGSVDAEALVGNV